MKQTIACLTSLLLFGWRIDASTNGQSVANGSPSQILIEAAVFEVTLPDTNNKGQKPPSKAEDFSVDTILKESAVWSTNLLRVSANSDSLAQSRDFKSISLLGNNFKSLLSAVMSDAPRASVFQRPRVTANLGTPATFFVGMYPYDSHEYHPAPNYLRIDWDTNTAWSVNITPSLLPGGILALKIETELGFQFGVPTTLANISKSGSLRSQSIITAHPGEILMMDGGIKAVWSEAPHAIPVLNHLPFIGAKFDGTGRPHRSRMFILLCPQVITDPEHFSFGH